MECDDVGMRICCPEVAHAVQRLIENGGLNVEKSCSFVVFIVPGCPFAARDAFGGNNDRRISPDDRWSSRPVLYDNRHLVLDVVQPG